LGIPVPGRRACCPLYCPFHGSHKHITMKVRANNLGHLPAGYRKISFLPSTRFCLRLPVAQATCGNRINPPIRTECSRLPNTPIAPCGSAFYQWLGETALAQIATPMPQRDGVLAQVNGVGRASFESPFCGFWLRASAWWPSGTKPDSGPRFRRPRAGNRRNRRCVS